MMMMVPRNQVDFRAAEWVIMLAKKRLFQVVLCATGVAGSVLLIPRICLAQSTPATNSTVVQAALSLQCSTSAIGSTLIRTYSRTINSFGRDLDNNVASGVERRVTQLNATDDISFDCNTSNVAITVDLDVLTAPSNFSNAVDIDLITNPVDAGVDHRVGINVTLPSSNTTTTIFDVNDAASSTVTAPTSFNLGFFDTDDQGDIRVSLASRFLTINGAEELAAGTYETRFTVTVVAQ